MAPVDQEIKTMKLYTHIERVFNELEEQHLLENGSTKLDPEKLSSIDSLHYLGNQAVINAIKATNLKAHHRVLDIGSGLGGPARMLAYYRQCRVDAYELQPDLHQTAQELTVRCGLEDTVKHFQGDFLKLTVPRNAYNAIVSFLVFLHICNRPVLFGKCAQVLQPGGRMYVEDFILRDDEHFTVEEEEILAKDVYVDHPLPTLAVLIKELHEAGLQLVEARDMTAIWTRFVVERFDAYKSNLPRHERVHGKDGAHDLLHFFEAVQKLFLGGHLGGIAYTVEKRNASNAESRH